MVLIFENICRIIKFKIESVNSVYGGYVFGKQKEILSVNFNKRYIIFDLLIKGFKHFSGLLSVSHKFYYGISNALQNCYRTNH